MDNSRKAKIGGKVMNSFILVLIAITIFAIGAGLYFYFSEKKHQH
jgi:flagellar basal body-associated protein FliL